MTQFCSFLGTFT